MRYIIKRGGTYTITTGITRGNLKTNVPVPKKEEDRREAGAEGRPEKAGPMVA